MSKSEAQFIRSNWFTPSSMKQTMDKAQAPIFQRQDLVAEGYAPTAENPSGVLAIIKNFPLAYYDIPTSNHQVFQRKLWEGLMKSDDLSFRMSQAHSFFGEAFHNDSLEVLLPNVSHRVDEFHFVESASVPLVAGTVAVLDTPNGNIIHSLMKSSYIGISSRGYGTLLDGEDGNQIVSADDYLHVCWDFVGVPAVKEAMATIASYAKSSKLVEPIVKALLASSRSVPELGELARIIQSENRKVEVTMPKSMKEIAIKSAQAYRTLGIKAEFVVEGEDVSLKFGDKVLGPFTAEEAKALTEAEEATPPEQKPAPVQSEETPPAPSAAPPLSEDPKFDEGMSDAEQTDRAEFTTMVLTELEETLSASADENVEAMDFGNDDEGLDEEFDKALTEAKKVQSAEGDPEALPPPEDDYFGPTPTDAVSVDVAAATVTVETVSGDGEPVTVDLKLEDGFLTEEGVDVVDLDGDGEEGESHSILPEGSMDLFEETGGDVSAAVDKILDLPYASNGDNTVIDLTDGGEDFGNFDEIDTEKVDSAVQSEVPAQAKWLVSLNGIPQTPALLDPTMTAEQVKEHLVTKMGYDKDICVDKAEAVKESLTPAIAGTDLVIEELLKFEQAELGQTETISLFQKLIDSGVVAKLKASYQRTAQALIDSGLCSPAKKAEGSK